MPEIDRWLDGLRAHPAFSRTCYHGSVLTEKYPGLKVY